MKHTLALLCMVPLAFPAHAANSYKINAGATVSINEHGTCKRVKNNKSSAIFVPTKTSAEWSAFRNGSGSGATFSNCVRTCTLTGGKWCNSPRDADNIIRSKTVENASACLTYCEATSGIDVCEFYSTDTCYAWGPCTLGNTVPPISAGKCTFE